jgi:hypothetical protein
VCQGQKLHLFRLSLSFLAEAQPRLANRRGQIGTLHFLGDRTNHKARDIIEKITKFILYLPFQIGKFINTY